MIKVHATHVIASLVIVENTRYLQLGTTSFVFHVWFIYSKFRFHDTSRRMVDEVASKTRGQKENSRDSTLSNYKMGVEKSSANNKGDG